MLTTNPPGVYIEEDASLSLTLAHGSTSVPVFAHNQGLIKSASAIRINSWLEFTELDDFKQAEHSLPSYPLFVSLKVYFENGGWYCYVCPTDRLATLVPELGDVTLIVSAGENLIERTDIFGDGGLCSDGGGYFAILDGPSEGLHSDHDKDMKSYPTTSYAAAYYPNLTAPWAAYQNKDGSKTASIPASAAVAAVYCTVDRERGVWKSPANVALRGGVAPQTVVSDDIQALYTASDKSLNMIRAFVSGQVLVLGARTLSNDATWRYVPVRRLVSACERDIKGGMSFALFEPNSEPTWERVRSAIDTYLNGIWKQGGLMGNTSQEAYFVQVGLGVTMAQDDIDRGQMIVKVGIAAVRPAEFTIFQVIQNMKSS